MIGRSEKTGLRAGDPRTADHSDFALFPFSHTSKVLHPRALHPHRTLVYFQLPPESTLPNLQPGFLLPTELAFPCSSPCFFPSSSSIFSQEGLLRAECNHKRDWSKNRHLYAKQATIITGECKREFRTPPPLFVLLAILVGLCLINMLPEWNIITTHFHHHPPPSMLIAEIKTQTDIYQSCNTIF